jgi:hypothetical protein
VTDTQSDNTQEPPPRPERGFFRELIAKVDRENPKAFELSPEIKALYKNGQSPLATRSPLSVQTSWPLSRGAQTNPNADRETFDGFDCLAVASGPNGEFIDTLEHRGPNKNGYVATPPLGQLWTNMSLAC